MNELHDFRGSSLSWIASPLRPLRLTISSRSGEGQLIEVVKGSQFSARLAEVGWAVEQIAGGYRVRFENGPVIAEAQHGFGAFEVEIDGTTRYRFQPRKSFPESRFGEGWIDSSGHPAVLFHVHPHRRESQSGEILVSEAAILEQVPILAILGLLEFTAWRPRSLNPRIAAT